MAEMVQTGNEISKLMLQALPATHPGAHIGPYPSDLFFSGLTELIRNRFV